MKYGFIKVATAIPEVRVADCVFNAERAAEMIKEAAQKDVQIVVFPEFSMTGYTCGDLFAQRALLQGAKGALQWLLEETKDIDTVAIVGTPLQVNAALYNCAVVIQRGKILGIVPKTYLPNYHEFMEKRWFASAYDLSYDATKLLFGERIPISSRMLFHAEGINFGIEICEDLWSVIPPSSLLTLKGADIIFNLSATTEQLGKNNYLRNLLAMRSEQSIAGYVYVACGFGESTTDVVFGGHGYIYEKGELLAASQPYSMGPQLITAEIDVESLRYTRRINTTFAAAQRVYLEEHMQYIPFEFKKEYPLALTRKIERHPFVPDDEAKRNRYGEDTIAIQSMALAHRLQHAHCEKVVIGISGGLDSTLALLACVECFDRTGRPRENIIAITMPGFGTTSRTYQNALELMASLGVTARNIDITASCKQHLQDIGHSGEVHDTTFENVQARERTQILMDVANMEGGLVIGTGDLSELALGWCTYNGDQMSMYALNGSIPKTLVRHIVRWYALHKSDDNTRKVLLDILDTPISPELVPNKEGKVIEQKTEDIIGPYELHDFFLYYMVRCGFRPRKIFALACYTWGDEYDAQTIKKWLMVFIRRFFSQQFKRSCMPDGPKISSISLSPRGDWHMPSDASANIWLRECEEL